MKPSVDVSWDKNSASQKTIVIVDDQRTARDVHAAIVRSLSLPFDVKIVPMQSAQEALTWMAGKSVDLVISDFMMADTTFDRFSKSITNLFSEAASRPKHILITSSVIQQESCSYMVNAYLQKPVKRNTLEPIVNKLLGAQA